MAAKEAFWVVDQQRLQLPRSADNPKMHKGQSLLQAARKQWGI
jgi:hypothetical protein